MKGLARKEPLMDGLFLLVFNSLLAVSIVSFLLFQFLPYRYTVREMASANIKTWCPAIWSLPWQMLTGIGKALRISIYLFAILAMTVLDVGLFI
jgi:hypothetical protein